MQPQINTKIESVLQDIIFRHFKDGTINIFDEFVNKCQHHNNDSKSCTTLSDIKRNTSTKHKGDLFEHFCLKYLQTCYGLPDVWLLKDLPANERTHLGIPSSDCGIDIVGKDAANRYYAIQAKFRKPNKWKTKKCVGWKDLSTFFALVARSGPWHKQIVMTNADYIKRVGNRSEKDVSICLGTFQGLSIDNWLIMANMVGKTFTGTTCGQTLGTTCGQTLGTGLPDMNQGVTSGVDMDEMRLKRLLKFTT